MPSLRLARFAGLRPRVDARLLPDDYAQVAHQTRLVDGTIRPWRSMRQADPTIFAKTVYRVHDVNGTCGPLLTFDHCVSMMPYPAPGVFADLDHYLVWHHNGEAPQRYFPASNEWAPLIVPAPTTRLSLQRITSTALSADPYRGPDQRAYTYTWVDKFGVESPPAPPSVTVRAWDDETWEVDGFDAPPPNAVALRIYRTAPSFDDGEQVANPFDTSFQLVREVELPFTGPFIDDVRGVDIETGTLLTAWDLPPEDMTQVVDTEQGYLVGFRGNDIWISERYEPHNWPERYRINLPDRIIALVSNGDWVYVVTTGHPYRFRPEMLTTNDETDLRADVLKYPMPWPGMGRNAVCWAPWGAMYVTLKGLVAMTPDQVRLITPQRIEIDDWIDWAPNIMAWYDGRLYAWRSPEGRGFVLDLPESGDQMDPGDLVTVDTLHLTHLHVGRDGWLYLATDSGVKIWGQGPAWLPWRWRSKAFVAHGYMRYTALKLVAEGTVTVALYVDGVKEFERTLDGGGTVRLPQMRRGQQFEVELSSDAGGVVYDVHFATSKTELAEA